MKNCLRAITAIGLSVLMSVSAASCSQSKQATASKTASSGPVTLTMLDFFVPGDPLTAVFRNLYNDFLKSNTNITIQEESLSNANMQTKVQTLAAANQLPDIFMVKGQVAPSFVESGRLKDLDYILNSDKNWKNSFSDGVFSNFTFDNKVYAIPYQVSNTCIFYNTAILADCGITAFPTDWNGFIDMVQKIKAKGITPISLGDKDQWPAESVIFSTLANRFTGDDWYASIRNRKGAKFTDTQFVNALSAFSELVKDGAFNSDATSIDNNQQKSLYYNKKAAITIDGTWAFSDFAQNCPQDVIATTSIAAFPSVNGGKGDAKTITGGAGWGYGVNAQLASSKSDAVAKFIKAINNQTYAKGSIENNGFPAIKVSDYDASKLTTLTQKFYDFKKDYKYIPVYDHQLSTAVINALDTGLQSLLVGSSTPQNVAASIQSEYASES